MDSNFIANVKEIEDALPDHDNLVAPSMEEICKIIDKIKGPLQLILPAIELIPIYGKTIAAALRLLLKLAETVCPK